MNKELKLCPFCGSSAEIIHYSEELFGIMKYARVKCRVCGSRGPQVKVSLSYSADDKAVEAWNRRSHQEAPQEVEKDMYKDIIARTCPAKDVSTYDVLREIKRICDASGTSETMHKGDMAELTIYRRIKRK